TGSATSRGCRTGSPSVLAEQPVDERVRRGPVVGAVDAPVHDGLVRGVEHLVLELASAVLGPDQVPDELEELDPVVGTGGAGLVVALGVRARLRREEARL